MADNKCLPCGDSFPAGWRDRPRYVSIEEIAPPLKEVNDMLIMFDETIIGIISSHLLIVEDFIRRFDAEIMQRIESTLFKSDKLINDFDGDISKRIASALEWIYERMPYWGIDPGDPEEMERVIVDHPGLLEVTVSKDCEVKVKANLCPPARADDGMVAHVDPAPLPNVLGGFPLFGPLARIGGKAAAGDGDKETGLPAIEDIARSLVPDWLLKFLDTLAPIIKTSADIAVSIGSIADMKEITRQIMDELEK